MLATALKFADDSIPEGASFAETGGFVFSPQKLNKVQPSWASGCWDAQLLIIQVIGNAGGFYVESELFADAPPHDVTGLTRYKGVGCWRLWRLTWKAWAVYVKPNLELGSTRGRLTH